TSKGRGTRITVRGPNDRLLADIIMGKPVEARADLRYVRVPTQKRIYVARTDTLNISTKFEDWMDRNLLQVQRDDIDGVAIKNYSFDQKTGDQTIRDLLILQKKGQDDWVVAGMQPNEEVMTLNLNLLVTTLQQLAIVDVGAKPPGVTAT